MKFTPDGYTQPMSPRPLGLLLGAALALAGIGLVVTGNFCIAPALILAGLLFALNETGTKRIRVTRTKLLIEEESRVRGLLIGPRRSRMAWDQTQSVDLHDDRIEMQGKTGELLVLGQGGPKVELQKLKNRIDQAMED